MPNTIRDRRYPKCSRLGVLRRTQRRPGGMPQLVVSTGALQEAVGWKAYQEYLPLMTHRLNTGPTPESAEAFLETLNGSK
jgi:hypothetical protein